MSDLCNHDWVGDDECRYCICEALVERIAELEQDLREMDAENDRLSTERFNEGMERAAVLVREHGLFAEEHIRKEIDK